ncbi:MAG: hypothetical protein WAN65_12260, partial [Candidatus Sulfotelmatobacter sp.]
DSHIVRVIDYWLAESRKPSNKGWQVIAVLAAESIRKSRYFPVVEFLSQKLPLTVLEVAALNVGGKTALTFTKFFDGEDQLEQDGAEEDDAGRVDVDRNYWAQKRPQSILRTADSLAKIFQSTEKSLRVTYLQNFWGFALGEKPFNFVTIAPKQRFVNVRARVRDTETWSARLKKAGFDLTGGTPARSIRFRVTGALPKKSKELLRQIGEEAYTEHVR